MSVDLHTAQQVKGEFSAHFRNSFFSSPDFSCHGSWREPDRLRGGGGGGQVEYLIVKESAPSERRLCARISESSSGFGPSVAAAGGALNFSLVASDLDCPRPDSDSVDADTVWDFSLSRASE